MINQVLKVVEAGVLLIMCLSCTVFADTRQYMCVNGEQIVRSFCADFMDYDFCKDCPSLQNNNDSEWCFCKGNASEMAVMNVGCLQRKKDLKAPIITSVYENNSLIESDSLETMYLMNISYRLDALHYISPSEHIAIDISCSYGMSLFILEPLNSHDALCEKSYVYECVLEGEHVIILQYVNYATNIFAETVNISLIDTVGFYGDTCSFTSRVERVTTVASDVSNKLSITLKPSEAPFVLHPHMNEINEFPVEFTTLPEALNFTDVNIYVLQPSDTTLWLNIDMSQYSLLTTPMTKLIQYKFVMGNISKQFEQNVLEIRKKARIKATLFDCNNESINSIEMQTPTTINASFIEWRWETNLLLIEVSQSIVSRTCYIQVEVNDGQGNIAFMSRKEKIAIDLSWSDEVNNTNTNSTPLPPSMSSSCKVKWMIISVIHASVIIVLLITLIITTICLCKRKS